MAAKLKSILRPTHWSLLIKSVVFVFAWLLLPFWAFALVAAYLFFFPWFQTGKFMVPFLALVGTAYVFATPYAWAAVLLLASFYLLLGIKELIFVQRHIPYHASILLILFVACISLFSKFNAPHTGSPALWGVLLIVLFFAVAKTLFDFVLAARPPESLGGDNPRPLPPALLAAVLGFLAWQMLLVIGFLPLSFFYQAAALFLALSAFLDFAVSYYSQELDKQRVLATAGVFAGLMLVVLSLSPWNL